MRAEQRIRMIRLMEKINDNKEFSEKLGINVVMNDLGRLSGIPEKQKQVSIKEA